MSLVKENDRNLFGSPHFLCRFGLLFCLCVFFLSFAREKRSSLWLFGLFARRMFGRLGIVFIVGLELAVLQQGALAGFVSA